MNVDDNDFMNEIGDEIESESDYDTLVDYGDEVDLCEKELDWDGYHNQHPSQDMRSRSSAQVSVCKSHSSNTYKADES